MFPVNWHFLCKASVELMDHLLFFYSVLQGRYALHIYVVWDSLGYSREDY